MTSRTIFLASAVALLCSLAFGPVRGQDDLKARFADPPDEARPGVYWYFMDGNLNGQGMTGDLEAMREAGIGNLVFLEVNVGVPRGPVDFLSPRWQELFAHAVHEAERLGIEITLGSGPGWAGSGGPWVTPEQSMQHLVGSPIEVKGPVVLDQVLPRPEPREPYFGGAVSGDLVQKRADYYEDVAVLAFPTPAGNESIPDVDEKALYYRAPYTSVPGVKPYLPAPADYPATPAGAAIDPRKIVDLTDRLQPDGRLQWDVPAGDWTIVRFGRRNNGATTRPAPLPGFGFECDKLDAEAFDAHFNAYVAPLLEKVGPRKKGCGWTMLHIDSWEMGAQNWTPRFREEFRRRRGYDPLSYLPTYLGRVVGDRETSERFLWDLRLTAQELVLENHAGRLKQLAHKLGMGLSIEPYDMNPTSDLDLGGVADVPMCEFWSDGFGFDSSFSCFESTSIAHTLGRPVVAAEAFTAGGDEAWKLYPGALKNQGDWAFCTGINRFVYHTFAHKPEGRRPGMVMGPYGVHWDRGQTWWPMASAYHRYITRCQYLLRQGRTAADVCYLIPEGAPHVFRPPSSALYGSGALRDRRGYNFDGCSPNVLLTDASVKDGRLVFTGGAEYRLLVLPDFDTMTPALLGKIAELVEAGATVVGPPPRKSPSLVDYPQCDRQVAALAERLWGGTEPPTEITIHPVGRGKIVWGGGLYRSDVPNNTPRPIEGAKWIWYPEGNPAASVEPCTRYFRRDFMIPPDKPIRSARIEGTADNDLRVWINGLPVIEGNNFHLIYTADCGELLAAGENTLAVEGVNGGDNSNPAGLIVALRIDFMDGDSMTLVTDKNWRAAREVAEEWRQTPAEGDAWLAAVELGPVGMDPWRLDTRPNTNPELYPDYALTSKLLADAGLPPDFESDSPIRYTHRQVSEADLYFVSNRTAQPVKADCTFRVAGKQPQLWDPIDGTTRPLPQFTEQAGRTTVPMRLEPYQSFFVVFSDKTSQLRGNTSSRTSENFPSEETILTLDGPWDVAFDPTAGGPPQARFETLEDWTKRPEPGIQYYSGIATYSKTFDWPGDVSNTAKDQTIRLDLGVVHNLARVRLNGRDLGVVWTAPWSVDITDALRSGENRLEIDVANLWPNRLIGDSKLPPEQRIGWTTYNPYRADSPLLPSGLLGPVTVRAVR